MAALRFDYMCYLTSLLQKHIVERTVLENDDYDKHYKQIVKHTRAIDIIEMEIIKHG